MAAISLTWAAAFLRPRTDSPRRNSDAGARAKAKSRPSCHNPGHSDRQAPSQPHLVLVGGRFGTVQSLDMGSFHPERPLVVTRVGNLLEARRNAYPCHVEATEERMDVGAALLVWSSFCSCRRLEQRVPVLRVWTTGSALRGPVRSCAGPKLRSAVPSSRRVRGASLNA